MTTPVCRLLPFVNAGGAWQMAADETMLEAAAEGIASFRLYGWSPATLSLGYFQPANDRFAVPLLASLPFVRRASGGAALVHDREVTYALALPPGPPWQTRNDSWVRRMHGVVHDVLAAMGVETSLCVTERKLGEVLCFLHHTPNDLLLDGAKVSGSASRKLRGGLLQHGSILLAQSPHAPALPGIAELKQVAVSVADFTAGLKNMLAHETGWQWEVGDWTVPERQRIEEITATKYANAAWNNKR